MLRRLWAIACQEDHLSLCWLHPVWRWGLVCLLAGCLCFSTGLVDAEEQSPLASTPTPLTETHVSGGEASASSLEMAQSEHADVISPNDAAAIKSKVDDQVGLTAPDSFDEIARLVDSATHDEALLAEMPAVGDMNLMLTDAGDDAEELATASSSNTTTQEAAPLFASRMPLADPVVSHQVELRARRSTVWQDKQTDMQWVLLEGDVGFEVGHYAFTASRAVVRIMSEPSPGRTIRHYKVLLEDARSKQSAGTTRTSVEAKTLLVTASSDGELKLHTDQMLKESAAAHPAVIQASQRFTEHDKRLARKLARLPRFRADVGPVPGDVLPVPGDVDSGERDPNKVPGEETGDGSPEQPGEPGVQFEEIDDAQRILPVKGVVSFRADRPVYDGERNVVLLIGNVRLLYHGPDVDTPRALQAERAVIFLDKAEPGAAAGTVAAGQVAGIYLEDNVVTTDGNFTVRAPRVYYDVKNNRAMLLDAVVFTYDATKDMPLYVRASEMVQESRAKWTAKGASFTTSDFAHGTFEVAASKMTIGNRKRKDGSERAYVTAEDVRFKAGGVPFFYLPYVAGDNRTIPINDVTLMYENDTGFIFGVGWDLYFLLGRTRPEGVEASLLTDYYGEHNLGLGIELKYDLEEMFGSFDAYALVYDTGDDDIGGRNSVPFDGDQRGHVHLQHRQYLEEGWELTVELAYVSDPSYLEEFHRAQAQTSKPWETLIYLKKQEDDWAATFLTEYDLNNFTPQTALLQSPGYNVEKTLEASYHRIGNSFWKDRLTYYGETSLAYMRIRPGRDAPNARGFNMGDSLRLFGIPNTTTYENGLEALGFTIERRLRFDSRHEVQMPLQAGPVHVTPYAVGRFTAYDDHFRSFAGEDDQFRFLGTVGVRSHVELHRSYPNVRVPLLDVNGIRHIVEPYSDIFITGSTLNPEDIPVYDDDVEGLSEGAGIRLGVRNTFQTRRGGVGRWRTVDWLTVNSYVVFRSGDADNGEDLSRFFGYRPELSQGGDHFYTEAQWRITEVLGAAGELIYDIDEGRTPYWRLGGSLNPTGRLNVFLSYSEIDSLNARVLSYGFGYDLTVKYRITASHSIDLGESESRWMNATLTRRFRNLNFGVFGGFNEIENDFRLGVTLSPQAAGDLIGGGPRINLIQ